MTTKATEKRLTDSARQAQDAAQKRKLVEQAQLVRCLNATFKTAEGIRALRHLMNLCGYQRVSVVGNPQTGDVHDRGTLYNEARRNVYLEIRKLIHPETLMRVEFPETFKDEESLFET